MSRNHKKYAKQLSKKIANIPSVNSHKMPMKAKAYNGEHMEEMLLELEKSLEVDLFALTKYEDWLEAFSGEHKTR
ncbi:MAG: hypothetical protein IJW25_01585 [Clostridia bacterium]|nr:hypothetical protein [Clostridia bacterium]